jgi:hypothetical protein
MPHRPLPRQDAAAICRLNRAQTCAVGIDRGGRRAKLCGLDVSKPNAQLRRAPATGCRVGPNGVRPLRAVSQGSTLVQKVRTRRPGGNIKIAGTKRECYRKQSTGDGRVNARGARYIRKRVAGGYTGTTTRGPNGPTQTGRCHHPPVPEKIVSWAKELPSIEILALQSRSAFPISKPALWCILPRHRWRSVLRRAAPIEVRSVSHFQCQGSAINDISMPEPWLCQWFSI